MKKYIIVTLIILYKSTTGLAQKPDLDSLVKMSPKLQTVLEFRESGSSISPNLIPVKTFAANETVRLCCCGLPPLYILDGKEITTFEGLDPKSIESISVLKDKSAIEIYGKKGENGVIIITSKKK